ncbi:hypothetical protein JCM8097_006056 [Rhodosporidiobolus ruineniae]
MPFDAQTGIYSSPTPDIALPDPSLNFFDFLFSSTPYSTAPNAFQCPEPSGKTWLTDAATGTSYTFEQVRERTLSFARLFAWEGLGAGTTLAIVSENCIDYGPWMWAAWRVGAAVTCLNPAFTAEEQRILLEKTNVHSPIKLVVASTGAEKTVVAACEKSERLDPVVPVAYSGYDGETLSTFSSLDNLLIRSENQPLPPISTSKVAMYAFSSGTTGLPKVVPLTHFALICQNLQGAVHLQAYWPARPDDKMLAVVPLFHGYGQHSGFHTSLVLNTPVVILPKFSLPAFFSAISKHRITRIFLVPPMLLALLASPATADLSSLRFVLSGGAPLAAEAIAAFREKYPDVVLKQAFGATEGTAAIAVHTEESGAAASSGVLLPNVRFVFVSRLLLTLSHVNFSCSAKIVSKEGVRLPPGELGELLVSTPSHALGYLNEIEATKETFLDDGFFRTGDLCRFDDNDLLYIVDRFNELIKVSGFQVAPAELEGHLLAHDDIDDAAVIGIPDSRRGEVPKAYIVLSAAARARLAAAPSPTGEQDRLVSALKQHVLDHKVYYKALGEVEVVDSLPRGASGKLLRRELRALHTAKAELQKAKL